jgi:hypothetical protein
MTTSIQIFKCNEKTGQLVVPKGMSVLSVGIDDWKPVVYGLVDSNVTETMTLRYVIAVAGDNLDKLVIGGLGFVGSVTVPKMEPLTYHVFLEMK